MAKKGKKPTSKPKAKAKVKKVEPILKDEAVEVKKTAPKKVKAKNEVKPKVEKKAEPKKKDYVFPICDHKETKRTLGARNRVMHICTGCGKIVRIGGR